MPSIDAEKRYICHFPEDNTIMSVNSGYGGNVLLGKKCFALRIASYLGRERGLDGRAYAHPRHSRIPKGEITYICRRVPVRLRQDQPRHAHSRRRRTERRATRSGASATTSPGCASAPDGRLWAINPENGFFGVAPGTNEKSNPNALAATRKDTIFTNVVHNLDDNTVWWEGLDKNPPKHALNWKGEPWNGTTPASKGAHPNTRFTAPAINCPVHLPRV